MAWRISGSEESLIRIVKDLLRLEMISRSRDCKHSWLIVGGPAHKFHELWCGQRNNNRAIARRFLPSSRGSVQLDPPVFKDHDERRHRRQLCHATRLRHFIKRAASDFGSSEIGVDFDVEFASPWRVMCDVEANPYGMPPLDFIVYGWNVGCSKWTKASDALDECGVD